MEKVRVEDLNIPADLTVIFSGKSYYMSTNNVVDGERLERARKRDMDMGSRYPADRPFYSVGITEPMLLPVVRRPEWTPEYIQALERAEQFLLGKIFKAKRGTVDAMNKRIMSKFPIPLYTVKSDGTYVRRNPDTLKNKELANGLPVRVIFRFYNGQKNKNPNATNFATSYDVSAIFVDEVPTFIDPSNEANYEGGAGVSTDTLQLLGITLSDDIDEVYDDSSDEQSTPVNREPANGVRRDYPAENIRYPQNQQRVPVAQPQGLVNPYAQQSMPQPVQPKANDPYAQRAQQGYGQPMQGERNYPAKNMRQQNPTAGISYPPSEDYYPDDYSDNPYAN